MVYPFIELALGVTYLINIAPFFTNMITVFVMDVSVIGVILAVSEKRRIQCACLGTGFNLPMSTVTIIEDLTMLVMAVWMVLLL